ncbi:MAG: site-specific DNA-methyltransferase, partial [Clostridia bacterium]|nr:site-specific DNA-methyltransferase [Clostridia bacterium]
GNLTKKVDFDLLRQELSTILIEGKDERYRLDWAGKRQAILTANSPIAKTLRPCREESVNFDKTENLYIEGDNLDVLKLLHETYLNKVKMIYIDPPYNTGNDFVYNDDFSEDSEEYLVKSNQKDDQGNRMTLNKDTSGSYHSKWLSIMYMRLKLARDLLAEDGAIFISIDDNEQANLKKICDEVFGESNYLGLISVINNLKGRSDDKFFATCNEFLLVYSRNINIFSINGFELSEEEYENDYDKKDEIGYYKTIGFRKTGNSWERINRPYMYYPVLYKNGIFSTITEEEFKKIYDSRNNTFDDKYVNNLNVKYTKEGWEFILPKNENGEFGRWRWGRETFFREKDMNLDFNNSRTLCTKMRATLEDGSIRIKTAKTLWYRPEYDTGSGAKILKNLFSNSSDLFNNPKSVIYIKDLIKIATNKKDLILDFFSGSATTAHAVMQLNAEDGGNRKFICVQLPELTDINSEAYKAGYKNICEIGKERIRRVGIKLKSDKIKITYTDGRKVEQNYYSYIDQIDVGFKVFKLDTSNLKKWDNAPTKDENVIRDRIQQSLDYIVDGRTDLDLVYEVMLKYGIDITFPISKIESEGKKAYIINASDYQLFVCCAPQLSSKTIDEFANLSVGTYIFADRCFATDNDLVNTAEILKSKNKEMRLF